MCAEVQFSDSVLLEIKQPDYAKHREHHLRESQGGSYRQVLQHRCHGSVTPSSPEAAFRNHKRAAPSPEPWARRPDVASAVQPAA